VALREHLSSGLSESVRERVELRLIEAGARKLRCPRRALLQAVENLVQNALEAHARAGVSRSVEVALVASDIGVRIEVRDHGGGIAPEIRERLGEPFVTGKTPGSGLGLGVYLAARFAEQVGGQLRFEQPRDGGTLSVLALGYEPKGAAA
jgi:two-component system C4-dicarboxylate transport sensor histidine kinase DctB